MLIKSYKTPSHNISGTVHATCETLHMKTYPRCDKVVVEFPIHNGRKYSIELSYAEMDTLCGLWADLAKLDAEV